MQLALNFLQRGERAKRGPAPNKPPTSRVPFPTDFSPFPTCKLQVMYIYIYIYIYVSSLVFNPFPFWGRFLGTCNQLLVSPLSTEPPPFGGRGVGESTSGVARPEAAPPEASTREIIPGGGGMSGSFHFRIGCFAFVSVSIVFPCWFLKGIDFTTGNSLSFFRGAKKDHGSRQVGFPRKDSGLPELPLFASRNGWNQG